MSRPGRELLHLTAPVAIAPQDSDEDVVVVKGFASVESSESDRSGDVVPPDEFDIEKFMVSPTLLVNHKFWVDDNGNGVAVGRPTEMHAVKVADIGNEKEWGVFDLKTKEQVNTFPKAQVPNLKSGDRGLFVVADVTMDDVKEMVKSGELGTFSWRGLVTADYRLNSKGVTERVLTDIDLYEVSLTHIPDQTSAQAVVVKSVNGVEQKLPLSVYCVRLEKSKYESKEIAEAYFKTHNLQCDSVKDEDGSFYGFQRGQSDFDASRLVAVKMADGVHVVAGPLKPDVEKNAFAWVTQLLGSEEVEKLADLNTVTENQEMSEETKEKVEKSTDEQVETTSSTMDFEAFGKELAAKTAEGVASALTPAFEGITTSMTTMGDALNAMAEKAAGKEEEEEEEEKEKGYGMKKKKGAKDDKKKEANEVEEETETEIAEVAKSATSNEMGKVFDVLNTLAVNLKDTQSRVADVAKTAEGLSKVTPGEVDRQEKVAVEKTASQDPNSIFDSAFPFIGDYTL